MYRVFLEAKGGWIFGPGEGGVPISHSMAASEVTPNLVTLPERSTHACRQCGWGVSKLPDSSH